MAFTEDMAAFFNTAEFAVVAVFTPAGGAQQQASVIFDAPTESILGDDQLSDEYAIMYPATDLPGVRAGDTGVIGGKQYKVREVRALDDGALKRARLSRL